MLWDLVVERVSKKLAAWKRNYISFKGRITLIKATLANISMYYMLIVRLPSKIVQKIERLQRSSYGKEGSKKRTI